MEHYTALPIPIAPVSLFHRTRAATAACLSVSLSDCWFVRNEGRLASTILGGMRNILRAFCVASTAL